MDVPVASASGAIASFKREDVPLRNAMNEILRDEYVEDAQRGLDKWNRAIEDAGLSVRLCLPHRRFHRASGIYAGLYFDVEGNPITKDEWERRKGEWLPTEADEAYVKSLMTAPIYEPGKMAHWIAPPPRGIKGRPLDFEYVKRAE